MAHTRRSLRNHHGKPHEHAPGDPLGVYLPPLSEWSTRRLNPTVRDWRHPMMDWHFSVMPHRRGGWIGVVSMAPGKYTGTTHSTRLVPSAEDAYRALKTWYSQQTLAGLASRGTRLSAQNPDWSAMRAKASHYGSRAATGAREAYEWTAPRAKRAAAATWEGAKTAGRAVKRGAKRAAPVVARGARSAAEGLDRWSQTNGRCAMRNGAALKWEKDGRDHVAATPFGKVVVEEYRTVDGPEWHAFLLVPEKYRGGHFRRFLTAKPSLAYAKDMAEWHISRLAK